MTSPDLLAALVAAVASFVVGGLWYSPLVFARPWQRLTGLSDDDLRARHPAAIFGGSFACALVGALVLASITGSAGPGEAALTGLALGGGVAATSLLTTFLFERRPIALALIDGGYHAVSFTLMGLLVGVIA